MITLQVAGFLDNSLVNGEGLRSVLFLSGCHHNCNGCHNEDMQDVNYGEQVSIDSILTRIKDNLPLISGITISGGEPFLQHQELLTLLESLRKLSVNVWVYTGYTYEEISSDEHMRRLLPLIDVLVDGRFLIEQISSNRRYVGSSNQRILKLENGLIS